MSSSIVSVAALLLLLMLTSQEVGARDEFTAGKEFYRTDSELTQVPDDIPAEALKVYLHQNKISTIPSNVFFNLSACQFVSISDNDISTIGLNAFQGLVKLTVLKLHGNLLTQLKNNMFSPLTALETLDIGQNQISEIEDGSFNGIDKLTILDIQYNKISTVTIDTFSSLTLLESLDLNGNQISSIGQFAFSVLRKLNTLFLYDNLLEELRPDMFTGLISLRRLELGANRLITLEKSILSELKRPLELSLGGLKDGAKVDNLLLCTESELCWLKHEETGGTITWVMSAGNTIHHPRCSNGVDWTSFTCQSQGVCQEPGGVEGAERSGAVFPYLQDSVVSYTCSPCHTGGGSITCQSGGAWTSKPQCALKPIFCEPPAPIERGTMAPSDGFHICGFRVTFSCDDGFTLDGAGERTCQTDGHFTGTNPTCIPESDSTMMVVGVASGVTGGIIVTIAVVVILICVKRRQKPQQHPGDGRENDEYLAPSISHFSQGQGASAKPPLPEIPTNIYHQSVVYDEPYKHFKEYEDDNLYVEILDEPEKTNNVSYINVS